MCARNEVQEFALKTVLVPADIDLLGPVDNDNSSECSASRIAVVLRE